MDSSRCSAPAHSFSPDPKCCFVYSTCRDNIVLWIRIGAYDIHTTLVECYGEQKFRPSVSGCGIVSNSSPLDVSLTECSPPYCSRFPFIITANPNHSGCRADVCLNAERFRKCRWSAKRSKKNGSATGKSYRERY